MASRQRDYLTSGRKFIRRNSQNIRLDVMNKIDRDQRVNLPYQIRQAGTVNKGGDIDL